MSERVISDPTVAGWELNPDTGYWMWAAGSGGGGSIQDGDTEGQITTWDGTEWTPEGAVVVDADGGVTLSHPANIKGRRTTGNIPLTLIGYEEGTDNVELITSGRWAIKDGAQDTLFSIDADTGSVNITGRLFINGDEVTAGGGGGGLWTDNGDGTISSAKTAKAPDFIAG
jgi:hypothetical protein